MEELRVRFEGRVQGVGFRWIVVDYAEKYDLKGTVQNLPDGSVEAIVQGDEVEAFLADVERNCAPARITSVKKTTRLSAQIFKDFRIIY